MNRDKKYKKFRIFQIDKEFIDKNIKYFWNKKFQKKNFLRLQIL